MRMFSFMKKKQNTKQQNVGTTGIMSNAANSEVPCAGLHTNFFH